MKDYKFMQEGSNLQALNSEKKNALSLKQVPLSQLPNGELFDGCQVMLRNPQLSRFLGSRPSMQPATSGIR